MVNGGWSPYKHAPFGKAGQKMSVKDLFSTCVENVEDLMKVMMMIMMAMIILMTCWWW